MGTFNCQGGSGYSRPFEVRGSESIEMDVAVDPPLADDSLLDVQESVDMVDWVSHPVTAWVGHAATVRLPEGPARRFVRVRLENAVPDGPPRRVRCRIRPRLRRLGGGSD